MEMPIADGFFIKRLLLSNFRNHDSFDIDVNSSVVIITGKNGAGKTNILEAISLLVAGRGFRGAKLSELDNLTQDNTDCWSVFSEIDTPSGTVKIGTGRDSSGESDKRIVKIDGERKKSQTALSRHFAVCWLVPRMDQTFVDGATSRRVFLDRITSTFFHEHTKHLSIYSRARIQRQRLLMSYSPDATWLSTLEKQMSEHGVAIAADRKETIFHLTNAIENRSSIFPKAILSITGEVEKNLDEMPALHVEEKMSKKLCGMRDSDKDSGKTGYGVHKSDFIAIHQEKNIAAQMCSTGEQKAIMLSITLATAIARRKWLGASPVLLLDEVTAHLDEKKRESFFHELEDISAQCWLTGTDISFFHSIQHKANIIRLLS